MPTSNCLFLAVCVLLARYWAELHGQMIIFSSSIQTWCRSREKKKSWLALPQEICSSCDFHHLSKSTSDQSVGMKTQNLPPSFVSDHLKAWPVTPLLALFSGVLFKNTMKSDGDTFFSVCLRARIAVWQEKTLPFQTPPSLISNVRWLGPGCLWGPEDVSAALLSSLTSSEKISKS